MGKNAVKYRWAWSHGDRSGDVIAYTKSEAKALIKAALGLSRNRRLPPNVAILPPVPVE